MPSCYASCASALQLPKQACTCWRVCRPRCVYVAAYNPVVLLKQCVVGLEHMMLHQLYRCTLQTALLAYSSAAEAASHPASAIQTASLTADDDMQSSASFTAKVDTHQATAAKTADANSSSTGTDTSSSPSAQHTPTSTKNTAVSQDILHASLDHKLCTCAQMGSAAECLCCSDTPNGVNAQGLDHQQSEGLQQCNASYALAGAAATGSAGSGGMSAGPHSSASTEASTTAQGATTSSGPLQSPLQPEQAQHRSIIEALLQSSQPWPAVDYEDLASKAGKQHFVPASLAMSTHSTLLGTVVG